MENHGAANEFMIDNEMTIFGQHSVMGNIMDRSNDFIIASSGTESHLKSYLLLTDPKLLKPMKNAWSCEFNEMNLDPPKSDASSTCTISLLNERIHALSTTITTTITTTTTTTTNNSNNNCNASSISNDDNNNNIEQNCCHTILEQDRDNTSPNIPSSFAGPSNKKAFLSRDSVNIDTKILIDHWDSSITLDAEADALDEAGTTKYETTLSKQHKSTPYHPQRALHNEQLQKLKKTSDVLCRFFGEEPHVKNANMAKLTLQFDDVLYEKLFVAENISDRPKIIFRSTVALFLALYALSAVCDSLLKNFHEEFTDFELEQLWIIRLSFSVIFLSIIAFTYTRWYRGQRVEQVTFMVVLLYAISSDLMLWFMANSSPVLQKVYYSFFLRCLIYCYSTVRLSFRKATIAGTMILVIYLIPIISYSQYQTLIQWKNFLYLLLFNITGMHYNYSGERNRRRLFLLRKYCSLLETFIVDTRKPSDS